MKALNKKGLFYQDPSWLRMFSRFELGVLTALQGPTSNESPKATNPPPWKSQNPRSLKPQLPEVREFRVQGFTWFTPQKTIITYFLIGPCYNKRKYGFGTGRRGDRRRESSDT